jgi:hypothetical protein
MSKQSPSLWLLLIPSTGATLTVFCDKLHVGFLLEMFRISFQGIIVDVRVFKSVSPKSACYAYDDPYQRLQEVKYTFFGSIWQLSLSVPQCSG